MSSDEKSGSQRAIKRPRVPPGPLADLKALLYQLYLEAGTPRLDQIEKWAAMAGQAGMPGRDTVTRIIGSATMPPSQADLVTVVTVLARAARWDPDDAARRVRDLWVAARMASARTAAGGVRVLQADPRLLGVHAAIGAETVCAAVHLMSQLYDVAMKETPPIVMVNPFAGLDLPEIRPHGIDFLERDEAESLYDAAGEFGARWRTLIELGTEVGLRPGELYGLHGHRVDWLRGKVQVIDVMTRSGLRQWPKSRKSHRVVPVPAHILEDMSALMTGRPRDALVFTAPESGPVDDGNFRDRIWYPAVEAAGIRRFPPRIMRHTAASWLVIDGVPLYDVQALLGHESYRTTERYAHLAPDAHDKVLQSWARRHDASVTHERKKGRPR